ncbi:DUF1302 domain-containing protein [Pseudomonas sp. MT3]|uniref:DUF1302 domain-containing protein n=1 Tax=Pseudomonas sp. ATCC 13867 TaxID=1294143 RepID=UPI0002C4E341|nr:DUF1302 domain-containing protein [Pseudomonas sp. ATCC 13867]AGI25183.1 hypothetical protein H681_16575 [Pseudomonas sp. ATCC 13867]RFQ33660.1 DUF1302 domain-containing protein [Pseudomonas sp. ATCC 13867]
MEIPVRKSVLRLAPARAGFALAGVLPLLMPAQAGAVEFSFLDNEVSGSLDTTVSYGALWRVQGQDKTNNDINGNDGNRNFDTGLVSEVYKITSDLEATYKNYGMFVRGSAFYDTQIMDKRNDYLDHNQPPQPSQTYPYNDRFTDETRDAAGNRAEILDAYVYGNWDVADHPLTARLGRQVFNWGEGVFYRGGVNTTNPVDAAKFRLPGSELKEVLMPVEAASFNIGLTDNLSMDAFYQWNWKETRLDPVGTYFSETDLFADGGNTAYTTVDALANPLFQSLYPQLSAAHLGGLQGTDYLDSNGVFKVASVGKDINAKNDGQFGVAFHYIAEELNSTEFGFYFVNYHAKEPTIYADLNQDYAGLDIDQLAGLGGFSSYDQLMAAAGSGNAMAGQVLGLVNGAAAVDVANQVNARREYVENIRMYGFSFNTTVGDASVFGELAYRPNLPIGIATTNDLLGDLLGQAPQLGSGQSVNIGGRPVAMTDQIHNYERVEAFNTSLGTIYNFGPSLSFDSLMGVAELASEHLRGSSLQYTAYDGSTRYYSGRGNGAYISGYDRDDQVNKNSYGYTLLLSGTWNDVFAGVNVSPYAVYKDDFEGNSYQTGNFIEGRKAYTLGVKASYLNALEAELQYTEFYGAGQNNAGRDRDNVGFNVKYSF